MGEGAAAAVAVCVFWGGGGGHLGFLGLGGGDYNSHHVGFWRYLGGQSSDFVGVWGSGGMKFL